MDARDIIQVEDFLFKNKRKRLAAASCMHSIVGVLIDLKPVAFIDFSAEEMKTVDCLEFKGMLEKIGLKCVFQHHQIASPDGLELFENIYISKKFDLAAKLRNVFIEMWSTMDDFGQVLDQKTWIRTSRQIGRMLGYPDTAIDGFIRDRIEYRTGDDSLTVIAGKYRTFAHSKKYLKKEIKAYDEPLEKAVKKYAPKTYALFEEADCGFSFNDSRVRKALEIALEKGKYSTSLVQVYVGLGQSTTSKLTIWLEKNKIISPSNGNRPRDLLIRDMADAEKILS